MSQIIEKDILDLTKDDLEYGKAVLLQQVNCQNEMDAGVAMAIDKLARKLFDASTVELYHKAWNLIFNDNDFYSFKQTEKMYRTTDLPLYVTDGVFIFS